MANLSISKDFGKVETSDKFERSNFGVADISVIIDVLTNLYSYPKQTLVQEYICNARDANREVNSNRAIEITAPTKFSPTFIVRDYGPGITPERMEKVFLMYGASTKRSNNKQTGGFGIGGKSAWAYVDSYVIETYVDGIKRVYVACKSGNGGSLEKISEEKTSEPNGTAIQIPVKPADIDDFSKAILRAVYFWKDEEKPIIHNISEYPNVPVGVYPRRLNYGQNNSYKLKIKENFEIYSETPSYLNLDKACRGVLVIDGIPYSLSNFINTPQILNRFFNYDYKLQGLAVFYVDNGVVQISRNREEIIIDETNTKYITKLFVEAYKAIDDFTSTKINSVKSVEELINFFKQTEDYIRIHTKYDIYNLNPDSFTVNSENEYLFQEIKETKSKYKKLKICDILRLSYSQLDNLYYVDDKCLNDSNVIANYRRKKAIDRAGRCIYLVKSDTKLTKKLIKDLKAKPLSDIDVSDYVYTRQVKTKSERKDICLHYINRHGILVKENLFISDVNELTVYSHFNDKLDKDLEFYITTITNENFCYIAKTNEKLIKDNKNFIHYKDWIAKHKPNPNCINWTIKTELESSLIKTSVYLADLNTLSHIKDKIKDKELCIILDKLSLKRVDKEISLPKIFKHLVEKDPSYKKLKNIITDPKEFSIKFKKKYPLLRDFSHYSFTNNKEYKKHIVEYINRYHNSKV